LPLSDERAVDKVEADALAQLGLRGFEQVGAGVEIDGHHRERFRSIDHGLVADLGSAGGDCLHREEHTTDVSISRICEESGVSRSSLYARFSDQDAIIRVVYADFCVRAREVIQRLDGEFVGLKARGAGFSDLIRLSIELHRDFYHGELGLVQAMRKQEAVDVVIREEREALDRDMMTSALGVFFKHFPAFEKTDLRARMDDASPMIVASFRSFLDFPDQLGAITPDAISKLTDHLTALLMQTVSAPEQVADVRRDSSRSLV